MIITREWFNILPIWMSALWFIRYFTISSLPTKQAALKGVEFALVGWFTLAPCLTSTLTTFKFPAPAATQSALAPSTTNLSNLTVPSLSTFKLKFDSNVFTTLSWPFFAAMIRGVHFWLLSSMKC